jgi:hypothetical protein
VTASSQLRVARDPALALVVRIFVGAVTERWEVPEPVRDDLRLAASELFSGAVETGGGQDVAFTLTHEPGALTLRASGVDAPGGDADEGAWGGRLQLVRALFPATELDDIVRIDVPLGV